MTFIGITGGADRARLTLRPGELVPRILARGAASARIALLARGALLLGGDQVTTTVQVGAGCALEIEDVTGTVAYEADGRPSGWHVRIRVERGGLLVWHGLPFVVADGADVVRSTHVDLAEGARALIRETLVMGRSGELGGELRATTRAYVGAAPLFLESLEVSGARPAPGILGGRRVMDTVQLFGARPEAALERAETLLTLDGPGAIARYLGGEAHRTPLDSTWRLWRAEMLDGDGGGDGDADTGTAGTAGAAETSGAAGASPAASRIPDATPKNVRSVR